MVASLALFYRRVQTDDKEHLAAVLVRQEEETEDRRHRYFVVERLAVELEERLENFDVITTTETNKKCIIYLLFPAFLFSLFEYHVENIPRCEALYFSEDSDGVPGNINNAGLIHHLLLECLDGINISGKFRRRNKKAHLHQADRGVVVLMELHGDLILPGQALRHVIQRYLERRLVRNIKAQHRAVERGRAPVPPLAADVLLGHLLLVRAVEELAHLLLVGLLEAGVPVQDATFQQDAQAPRADEILKISSLYFGSLELLDFSCFAILEDDRLVGHLQLPRRLLEQNTGNK